MKYSFHADPTEPDVYTIMRENNWFARVRVNGEYLTEKQQRYMQHMIDALNLRAEVFEEHTNV